MQKIYFSGPARDNLRATINMPSNNDPQTDLDLVPESVLKRRHDLDDLKQKRQYLADLQQPTKKKGAKGNYVRKPESFLAKAKQRRNENIRYHRVKKKGMQKRASKHPLIKTKEILCTAKESDKNEENFQIVKYQANSVGLPYVFCIRIREDAGHPPKCVLNILNLLRLKVPNTGVFLKYTPTTQRHLHLVEPWVIYGKPSDGIVEDLMERRSYGNVKGERVPLSDNTIIEQALGKDHGLICKEDLVLELTGSGDLFDVVAKFLWPFPLSASRSHFQKKLLAVKHGKDYGDLGDEIDEYIKQML
jgi:large subunit ribosomal protein L7e